MQAKLLNCFIFEIKWSYIVSHKYNYYTDMFQIKIPNIHRFWFLRCQNPMLFFVMSKYL